MFQPATMQVKALLNPVTAQSKFQFLRYMPSPELRYFVDWYWVIHWDLRGQEPYTQDVLTYPCVQFVVEEGKSGVFGLTRGKFSRQLVGKGRVIAAKFHAGGFYPFFKQAVTSYTDKTLTMNTVFGAAGDDLERIILTDETDEAALAHMDQFLCDRLPPPDPNVGLVNEIITRVINNPDITRVDELLPHIYLSKRSLQRLFHLYVGVSPKWVIQRYRLQEAAEQLAAEGMGKSTEIALRLGYFDQAHFIKDFKAIVGMPPLEYAKLAHFIPAS